MITYIVECKTKRHYLANMSPQLAHSSIRKIVIADSDGFIRHSTNDCPLPGNESCQVKFRNNKDIHNTVGMAKNFNWFKAGTDYDIIWYRPIQYFGLNARCRMAKVTESFEIGDKVKYPTGNGEVILPPDDSGCVIVVENHCYKRVHVSALQLTPSEEDEAVDEMVKLWRGSPRQFSRDLYRDLYRIVGNAGRSKPDDN